MTENQGVSLEQLAGMTDEEILLFLDATWPWPLDAVQPWFEDLWNSILQWLHDAVDWIYDRVKPLFDEVWNWVSSWGNYIISSVGGFFAQVFAWIQGIITPIVSAVSGAIDSVWAWFQTALSTLYANIQSLFTQVWAWLSTGFTSLTATVGSWFSALGQSLSTFAKDVGDKVSSINAWFSNEFIDPFLDWLIQFPGKIAEALKNFFVDQWQLIWSFWSKDWNWLKLLTGMILAFAGGAILLAGPAIGAAVITALHWFFGTIFSLWPAISGWLTDMLLNILVWIETFSPQLASWLLVIVPQAGTWLLRNLIPLIGAGTILTLEATGALKPIVHNLVAPALTNLLTFFESQGPVSPMPGAAMSDGVSRLAEFTITGLASMTLAGEMLSPLKQIGLGNISAIIYDLINYRTLTAAFMGVLAFVYIKTPLTYYYQKTARPNLPDERQLELMAEERIITQGEYRDNMPFHGYTDGWIEKMLKMARRPMTPYMLRSLAEAGLLDDAMLEKELEFAGYDDDAIPVIKKMMNSLAAGALTTVSTSTAMTRFQEGFDTEDELRKNLSTLGVAESMLDRYVFAGNLKYLYDYQTDLKNYYIDLYHRREIEEPELRSDLAAAGIAPDRIDVYVQAQSIKRLKAAAVPEPPELAIERDTVRDRRKKNLITRDGEISELVALGIELPLATAYADNDDVAMTPSGATAPPVVLLAYETDSGKIQVDTIRRERRQRQLSDTDELAALTALQMPDDMAKAIVDNDTLRLSKSTTTQGT
jgi:hypothetical protein